MEVIAINPRVLHDTPRGINTLCRPIMPHSLLQPWYSDSAGPQRTNTPPWMLRAYLELDLAGTELRLPRGCPSAFFPARMAPLRTCMPSQEPRVLLGSALLIFRQDWCSSSKRFQSLTTSMATL